MKKILFILIFFLSFIIYHLSSVDVSAATRTACPNGPAPNCLQQAVDSSHDGDTIMINTGTYSGTESTPFSETNTKTACFLNLGAKKLTLKGQGNTVLFGEGHDKPDVYANRAGVCSNGGDVTIDNIHIKEFQGGGLYFVNSRLIIKNSIVDGNDSGATHFNNTSLLAVNNYFVANIGIQPKGLASIKAINNTFLGKALNAECNQDLPPIDFVNNIDVDPEENIGAGWIYGNCPETIAQFKNKNIKYDLLWRDHHPCEPSREYCDPFTGKVSADPMFIEPAADERGIAAWANFGFKDGSPAIGAGDPTIPGGRDLGVAGGPCADPNSSICLNFIQNNQPPPPPTPTSTEILQPSGPGSIGQRTFGASEVSNITNLQSSLEYILKNLPIPATKKIQEEIGIDLFLYLIFSAVYIMFIHFAVGIKDFNIFLMIGYFILGGFIGYWFHSYEAGLVLSIILSLIFF